MLPDASRVCAVGGPAEQVESFEQLFHGYSRYVASIAFRLLGCDDEVDDVVQEVFLIAHKGLARLRDPQAVQPWLATVTVRIARRRLRMRRISGWFGLAQALDFSKIASADASPEHKALLSHVYQVLSRSQSISASHGRSGTSRARSSRRSPGLPTARSPRQSAGSAPHRQPSTEHSVMSSVMHKLDDARTHVQVSWGEERERLAMLGLTHKRRRRARVRVAAATLACLLVVVGFGLALRHVHHQSAAMAQSSASPNSSPVVHLDDGSSHHPAGCSRADRAGPGFAFFARGGSGRCGGRSFRCDPESIPCVRVNAGRVA